MVDTIQSTNYAANTETKEKTLKLERPVSYYGDF